ncbi:MerR family transcriptional regulator [Heyndrickxia acidiproducens]|uniref:MerR family transcriptional regulator n=1 Tax=Heyndrickxia acidiproducens TaxID=1121084 RepID=UPI00037BBB0D|nr:MerR family transcriptional regulator [Heyndrickxia acidiproducens]
MYRIGELASAANVSKRTIDYYTQLGLLKPKRTHANYRLYDQEAIADLKYIAECKKLHLPLESIRTKLAYRRNSGVSEIALVQQLNLFSDQLKQLNLELKDFAPNLDKLPEEQQETLRNHLSRDSLALIQSLSVLLNKEVVWN